MTAVTNENNKPIFDPPSTGLFATTMDALASLTSTLGISPSQTSQVNGLSIINEIKSDKSLDGLLTFGQHKDQVEEVKTKVPEKVKEYAKKWVVNGGSREDVERKMKELMEIAVVLYSATSRPAKEVRLDFFLMHTLTSSLFLPFFVNNLSPAHSARFLQAYFTMTVLYYISDNRPQFYEENVESYKSQLDYNDEISNPWMKVIERTIAHHDEHLVKAIRSLVNGVTYLANGKDEDQLAGGKHHTSRYWLNSAKMTLDSISDGRFWEQNGIGFEEVWEGKGVKRDIT